MIPRMAGHLMVTILCLGPLAGGEEPAAPAPTLNDVLPRLGLTDSSLEIGGELDWLGYVPPEAVPFRLPHIEAVLENPPLLARLGGNLSGVAARTLDDGLPAGTLAGVLTAFILHPRLPAFRGIKPQTEKSEMAPGSLSALLATAREDDSTVVLSATGWFTELHSAEGPEELALPTDLRQPVARLLAASLEAAWWVANSWRHLPQEQVAAATSQSDLTVHIAGGDRWWPEVEDAANAGDDTARAYAALLLARAIQETLPLLRSIDAANPEIIELGWEATTPLGRVVVVGSGDQTVRCRQDCLLVIDLGGNETYLGTVAGARFPENPISILIDLEGNDEYRQEGAGPAQGAGAGGVGLLVDDAGQDVYRSLEGAQGWGFLGYGILWDLGGHDQYIAQSAAQGSALFGGGLLLDLDGSDRYESLGESQGFGGPGGAGALVDLAGNDRYFAEPSADRAGRADYHSEDRVAANTCQGAGVGRRGDLSDGHQWAGGLGVLADANGNDVYSAGNFSQGIGYWLGTGMLLDGGGDDLYQTVYFSQGSGLHFGAGLLLDEAGDDVHHLDAEAGASLGYGWDFAVGVLVDGSGDDSYRLAGTGLGCAERRSIALFVDGGGADSYTFGQPSRSLGAVDLHFKVTDEDHFIWASQSASQVGLFIDLEGADAYRSTAKVDEAVAAGDNARWIRKAADDTLPERPNRGGGIDINGPSLDSHRSPHLFFVDDSHQQNTGGH